MTAVLTETPCMDADPRLENRVGFFFVFTSCSDRVSWSQSVEAHQEIQTYDTTTASGRYPVNFVDPYGLCADSWWDKTKNGAEFGKDFLGGASDFWRNYSDMREANTIGADKYFHAKANYEAASRGPGGEYFAEHFSNAREVWDRNVKGYPRSDSLADQAANAYGRSQAGVAPNGQTAAGPYRPNGLDPKY